ncbi:MAG: UvrD-helicase domain-containing protein [Bacteroidia bacterium]
MQGLSVYKSSAGSGKTFTLVKEYLKLVLKDPSQQPNILAITFTNKATGEMKHRIIHSLAQLADGQNNMLKNLLQVELPGVNIKTTARTVIEKILHNYSGFAVSTIDSFFHRIIKSFARELHLPLKFEIELDTGFVADQVIENLLKELNTRHDLSGWLRSFLMEKLADDKGWKIEREIAVIAKELFKENGVDPQKLPSRENIAAFRDKMITYRNDFEKEMKNLALQGIEVIKGSGLTLNDFSYKASGPAGYFHKIYNNPGDCEIKGRVLNALEDSGCWATKNSDLSSQITDLANKYLIPLLLKIKNVIDNKHPKYCTATEAIKYLYLIGILSDINEQIKIYRDEKNIILISDLPRLLHAGLSDSDTPFIYEKTGTVYKHFLIDEFQDTSDFQWSNILPLVKNSLSGNHFTLIVGDVKQSIYRWRGGNMELLMKNIKKHLSHYQEITKEIALSTNYRSKKEIVEFNNDFFYKAIALLKSNIEDEDSFIDLAYKEDELKQLIVEKNNKGGFTEIKFIDPEPINTFISSTDDEELKWKDIAMRQLLDTINNSINDGFHLKDIAILVRRNTEGNEIANFLFDNGIEKVVSPDSLLVKSSPRIRLLLSILRFIGNSRDHISRSHVLYYMSKHNFIENNLPVHDFFTHSELSKTRSEQFLDELESLDSLPLYEVAESIIRKLKFDKSPDAYLQRFLDLVLDYSIKSGSDINAFLNWFDENNQEEKTSLVVPENEDAISIMTIHKAKGLQFPVVIIPFADWEMVPHRNTLMWIKDYDPLMPMLAIRASKNLTNTDFKKDYLKEFALSNLDNLNLLYVAFTRPEDRLHIFTCLPKKPETITKVSQLIFNYVANEPQYNKETMTYQKGEREKIIKPLATEDETVALSTFISNDWSQKLKIRIRKRRTVEKSKSLKKAISGTIVHEALATLNQSADLPVIINNLKDRGAVSAEEIIELEDTLSFLLKQENIAGWFDGTWQIINEHELLLPGGEILRPDRVMVKDNKAVIVDYKTGVKEKSHHKQLNDYGQNLLEAGYAEVKKYLLYLNDKEIVEVN